jgi:hypothetical protein
LGSGDQDKQETPKNLNISNPLCVTELHLYANNDGQCDTGAHLLMLHTGDGTENVETPLKTKTTKKKFVEQGEWNEC